MSRLFINTYHPLVDTAAGRSASVQFKLMPFIDGSIRREPDLEHPHPSISCICRGEMFAPRLCLGDVVFYMTRQARFGEAVKHRRATALLRVARLFETHAAAAEWYRAAGQQVPSNCVVDDNPPCPVSQSHRKNQHRCENEAAWTAKWDIGYRHRARVNGRFVVCDAIWRDLSWNAPKVHDADLLAVFGRVPGTRNPGSLSLTFLEPLLRQLRIAAPPSYR
jgi:hypothetical protein